MYSLWRGNERLGEIVVRFPNEPALGVHGLLRPAAAFTDIGRMMQTTLPVLLGGAVHLTRFAGTPSPGPTPLRPMSEEEAPGLPPEQQLVLRDDDGQTLPMDLISIEPEHVPPGPGAFPDLCREHGFVDTAWVIAAFRHPPSRRPDSR